ncbi:hypothetical protein [Bifidobacterium olomucense]|uniref:UDP-N-acetylmuramyl-tripeptide synthetase n=1 Tax=Bifidobacterium olomucense TaxID=2675324 RepID=A0A7Y0EX99_9BIFI|nr:hypothetical protein [Bifidobacterium sp. DSM 109959]NMM97753.1 UDP-N-acetylmuramyl-tripeptide synthetase [Bifidobacterium sp. DSM 109959]
MSVVSESIAQRVTLGLLVEQYGFELDPPFASNVTVTSLSDAMDTVFPGSLFVCRKTADLAYAERAGAYAALMPRSMKGQVHADIPVMYGDCDDRVLGELASGLAGNPSNTMALFAVTGVDDDTIEADVSQLAEFLHMLGNPVAVISAAGSTSMTHTMALNYPLGILDVERTLSVCAEDGVAAVIVALNGRTLAKHALASVNVDVLGAQHAQLMEDVDALKERYSFVADQKLTMTTTTFESDEIAAESPAMNDRGRLGHLSLAVAMVLAAGVRKNNIRSALRVAGNLK